MKTKTVREIVVENKDRFTALKDAGDVTPKALYQIAVELGFSTRARFPHFKKALLAVCGLDYDVVKEVKAEAIATDLAAVITHEITLYTDFKMRSDKWAILDGTGEVVGYGKTFENLEQSQGELFAALKALDVAASARRNSNLRGIRLNLFVDAQWLTSLSGKAEVLAKAAIRFGVQLNIQWIEGRSNPADKFTTADGFQKIDWANTAAFVSEIGAMKSEPVTEPVAPIVSMVETPVRVEVVAASHPVAFSRQTDREAWFEAHKSEWPGLRDGWKAKGFTNKQRQELLEPMIAAWVAEKNLAVS